MKSNESGEHTLELPAPIVDWDDEAPTLRNMDPPPWPDEVA